VLGDGRLGNLCAQVLARLSDHVLVVGKHPEKLSILASMGIGTTLLSNPPDDRSFDVIVDCTGSESGLPTALKLVRPRGTIVLKTTVAGQQTLAWASLVIDEVTLIGSRCGPFDRALASLEQGHVTVQPLISERFDLSRGLDALTRAQTKGILKVLLDVS
jgi:threonine dehydrogenase-like Zn-dependent dehydrogenase